MNEKELVISAKAGIQRFYLNMPLGLVPPLCGRVFNGWIPAFAGMTN
jgi:hypothetical protein